MNLSWNSFDNFVPKFDFTRIRKWCAYLHVSRVRYIRTLPRLAFLRFGRRNRPIRMLNTGAHVHDFSWLIRRDDRFRPLRCSVRQLFFSRTPRTGRWRPRAAVRRREQGLLFFSRDRREPIRSDVKVRPAVHLLSTAMVDTRQVLRGLDYRATLDGKFASSKRKCRRWSMECLVVSLNHRMMRLNLSPLPRHADTSEWPRLTSTTDNIKWLIALITTRRGCTRLSRGLGIVIRLCWTRSTTDKDKWHHTSYPERPSVSLLSSVAYDLTTT